MATPTPGPTPRRVSRSERMLKDMLEKDTRSRSLSRNPSTTSRKSHHRQEESHEDHPSPSPYLARTRQSYASVSSQPPQPLPQPGDLNDVFSSSTTGSESSAAQYRPMTPSPAPGRANRPRLPQAHYTHDGVTMNRTTSINRPVSPSPARSNTSPLVAIPRPEQPPVPRPREIHGSQQHPWSMEDSSTPGSTPASQKSFENQSSSSSSSHPYQPCTPPSTAFNLKTANEFCRQQEGYISFSDIQGLGRPLEEVEEEQAERARLENEAKRKRGWWNWLEDGLLPQVIRPKTPHPPTRDS